MNELDCRVEPQEQTQWCWAAVSRSVASFYDSGSDWTQCSIASVVISDSARNIDCCGPLASTDCNKPSRLDDALRITGNFVNWSLVGGPHGTWPCISFDRIKDEIDNGRPIASRIGWDGGGGHFQLIYGWMIGSSGDQYLRISDPIYREVDILFESFASRYEAGGWWNVSYFTGPPSAVDVAGGAGQARIEDEDLPDSISEADLLGA